MGNTKTVLTRDEFDNAVRDALRNHTRADLLVGNPLLTTAAVKDRGSASPEQDLRVLLAETAATLFANGRDQKIHRVLELTYFSPAPKQEAAAERLGLSFSTYRRYLATGIARIAEWLWHQEQEAGREPPRPEPQSEPDISDRPAMRPLSIIVLPFLNLSADPELGYLVDGIVDNLMTDLSRALPGSFVISRSTAFTYKDRQVPVREIGEQLGVRYVLEGSVLADASRIRVNTQLVDAMTDEHLWAERFDKERKDILAVQEEIVARLSRSVGIEMLREEGERSRPATANDVDALDLVMRGRALATDIRREENAADAIALFRRALALDADNVDAMAGIASTVVFQLLNRYRTDARHRMLEEAEALISRAFSLAPDHIDVMKARGALLRALGRFEEGIVATLAIIERNPGEPTAYREMGLNKLYLGETREAADWFRRADRVAPRDPMRWTWLQGLGRALMQLGEDAEAVAALRQMIDTNPRWARGKALLAAAEALAGNVAIAQRQMADYIATDPSITVENFADERASVPLAVTSSVYRYEIERIHVGLRQAGMPPG